MSRKVTARIVRVMVVVRQLGGRGGGEVVSRSFPYYNIFLKLLDVVTCDFGAWSCGGTNMFFLLLLFRESFELFLFLFFFFFFSKFDEFRGIYGLPVPLRLFVFLSIYRGISPLSLLFFPSSLICASVFISILPSSLHLSSFIS